MPKTARAALGLALTLGFGGEAMAQRPAPIVVAPAPSPPTPRQRQITPPPVVIVPLTPTAPVTRQGPPIVRIPAPPVTSRTQPPLRALSPSQRQVLRATVPPQQIVTFVVAEPPLVVVPPGQFSNMNGWTALTNGATQGGASVVRLVDGQGRIVVRAGGRLHIAPIDLVNPGGPIDGSAWVQTSVEAWSEPHCQSMGGIFYDLTCGFLGFGNDARFAFFDLSENLADSFGSQLLGQQGPVAAFRPTIAPDTNEFISSSNLYAGFRAFSWNGISASRRDAYLYGGSNMSAKDAPWYEQWTAMNGAYATPFDCADNYMLMCAYGVVQFGAGGGGARSIRLVRANPTLEDNAAAPTQLRVTQPIPGGLSLNIAPALARTASGNVVVIARADNGRIYRETNIGTWVDEGGFTRAGSGISCLANNEQPICFVQGDDGRIYWKKLGTESGL